MEDTYVRKCSKKLNSRSVKWRMRQSFEFTLAKRPWEKSGGRIYWRDRITHARRIGRIPCPPKMQAGMTFFFLPSSSHLMTCHSKKDDLKPFKVMKIFSVEDSFLHSSWTPSDWLRLKISIWGLKRPFHGVFDRHKLFHHFSPFQKLIWTIIFWIYFEIGSVSEKHKDSFEWVPPAKSFKNFFSSPKAQKIKILPIYAETSETTRRAPSGRHLRGECFRTILILQGGPKKLFFRDLRWKLQTSKGPPRRICKERVAPASHHCGRSHPVFWLLQYWTLQSESQQKVDTEKWRHLLERFKFRVCKKKKTSVSANLEYGFFDPFGA